MNAIKIKSYAKINLSLNVTAKRDDGYHEIETVMQRISLCDEVTVGWTSTESDNVEIRMKCDKPYLPVDRRNLAYLAAELMAEAAGEGKGGIIDINIKKRIPVAAGLAGGSGNGAAVLIALSRLWNINFDTRQLCRIGEKLGADVPFCVLVQNSRFGCALCSGTGAELAPLSTKLKKAVLLVKPHFGVSTAEVYKGIDSCVIEERPDNRRLVQALKKGDTEQAYYNMVNVLEEYTAVNYPEVAKVKELIAKETHAEKVLMTGSGPTVFALFEKKDDAKKACVHMRSKGYSAYWATTI